MSQHNLSRPPSRLSDACLTPASHYSERNIAGLQDFADFLLRWQFLPAAVDVRGWIDARPYETALARQQKAA